MVCCADRMICELALKIGNVIAGLAGLFLLGIGLYLEFGGLNATDNLVQWLKLNSIQDTFQIFARFPIWICVIGGVIFIASSLSYFCTGSKLAKPFYCIYGTLLMLCALIILFAVIVLRLAANSVASNDYQKIEILGYDLTDKMQLVWVQSVVDDPKSVCKLQEVIECSGYFDNQCLTPPMNYSVEVVLAHCPAQQEIYAFTSNLTVSTSQLDNSTIENINEDVGWNVGKCLAKEIDNAPFGCLGSLAKILYQVGKVLFIPGLIIAGYIGALSLICTYLTCCTLCGV